MDEIRFAHCWLLFTGESSFLGGAGFRPSTVGINYWQRAVAGIRVGGMAAYIPPFVYACEAAYTPCMRYTTSVSPNILSW